MESNGKKIFLPPSPNVKLDPYPSLGEPIKNVMAHILHKTHLKSDPIIFFARSGVFLRTEPMTPRPITVRHEPGTQMPRFVGPAGQVNGVAHFGHQVLALGRYSEGVQANFAGRGRDEDQVGCTLHVLR